MGCVTFELLCDLPSAVRLRGIGGQARSVPGKSLGSARLGWVVVGRVGRGAGAFGLAVHLLGGGADLLGSAQVALLDRLGLERSQVLPELVHQRLAGRDVEADDGGEDRKSVV